jgi:hypothetical protein
MVFSYQFSAKEEMQKIQRKEAKVQRKKWIMQRG